MNKSQQIEKLTAELAESRRISDENYENGKKWKALADEREKIEGAQKKRIDDLKGRLANSESENNRMRGYISRVQEDDVVREELVSTVNSDGEQRMVPKRKPASFDNTNQYTDFTPDGDRYGGFVSESQRRANTKHWVTY